MRFWRSSFFSYLKRLEGQSLVEIMVGLAIGGILMGAAAFAISVMLRSSASIQKSGGGAVLAQDLIDKVRAYGAASWQNVYGLTKGTNTAAQYFLNASGSTYLAVQGQEGMIDNDVTSGLVGEWKFDEDAASTSTTTYDATGNNNNGTLVNSPARATSTCKISNCLSFDGISNYVNFAASSALNVTGNQTVSLWVKSDTAIANADIAGRWLSSVDNKKVWRLRTDSTYLTFRVSADGVTNSADATTTISSVVDGNLHHIAAVYDGSAIAVYVDGTLRGSTAYSGGLFSNVNTILRVGASSSGGAIAAYFKGLIDDVRIYNRALSADEVKRLYNSNVYSRYFYAQNACRATASSSTITGVSPCGGGSTDDPSTQQVTAVAQWALPGGSTQTSTLSDYLTRFTNAVFNQTDWSGGSGQEGPIAQPNNKYASATNIDTTSSIGSFRINNLSP